MCEDRHPHPFSIKYNNKSLLHAHAHFTLCTADSSIVQMTSAKTKYILVEPSISAVQDIALGAPAQEVVEVDWARALPEEGISICSSSWERQDRYKYDIMHCLNMQGRNK